MAFRDSYDTRHLVNVMEDFVFDAIDAVMPNHPEMCKCQDCMLDVAAIALNSLPPRYCLGKFAAPARGVHRLRHYVPEKEKDMVERARSAVATAMATVKEHPNH